MRSILPLLVLAVATAWPAAPGTAAPPRARVDGPAVAGQTVDIVVVARADGVRLTFPDLQGQVATLGCPRHRTGRGRPPRRRFVLPFRPAWPGRHLVTVSALRGCAGSVAHPRWTTLAVDVADAGPDPAEAPAGGRGLCRDADAVPVPRTMGASRRALACLLDGERRARGLPPLRADAGLRRAASLRAHRPGRRTAAAGRHVLEARAAHATPAVALATWLAADGQRRELLHPAARAVGISVVPRARGPRRRLRATWVLALG